MKFRKKPVVIEAEQWHQVNPAQPFVKLVRHTAPDRPCQHCGNPITVHGWVVTLEGGHIVCPGDWIITGVKGEMYACKPDIFDVTYESAQDEEGTICVWNKDDDGCHHTGCGHIFVITDGGLADNGMGFCCYCGLRAEEGLLYPPETQEDDNG